MARAIFHTHETSGACASVCPLDRTHQIEKTLEYAMQLISLQLQHSRSDIGKNEILICLFRLFINIFCLLKRLEILSKLMLHCCSVDADSKFV